MNLRDIAIPFATVLMAGACSSDAPTGTAAADQFMANLSTHCGKAYAGRLTSTDAADADFASQSMVMHVRTCSDDVIHVPFHVGDDHSRTWVISRTTDGLRLKHDHRHEDGEEDAVTQYGGDSASIESAQLIAFPVDQFSIDMFNREGLTASVTNVWAIELTDDVFAYELRRENRHFRVEFDVTEPVDLPWGADALVSP